MSRIKRAVKGFIDPITTKVEDWKWRALADVDKELKLKEVPDYIQGGYGGFMADQLKRAEAGDLNARDLIKAYTITQSSIGRGGLSHATATKRGLKLPDTGGEVRPEGAFAEWLGSPLGQRYLDMAERGELDSKALKEIQAAFAPFGKQNDQVAKMEWAAQNLPGMATDLNTRVTGSLGDWRNYTDELRGIAAAKSGFVGSLLGRGDVPTLDARQLNLHGTTPPVGLGSIQNRGGGAGGRELVDRLSARQEALGLKLDPSLNPFYQHLGHHAVWDKIGNTETTHEDLVRAMRDYNKGGAVHMAGGGGGKKLVKAILPKPAPLNAIQEMVAAANNTTRTAPETEVSDLLGRVAASAGMKPPVTAAKPLTDLQDFHTSLGDRINERVRDKQNLADSMTFKYQPKQYVHSQHTLDKEQAPHEILASMPFRRAVMREDKPYMFQKDEFGKTVYTPWEPGYRVRHVVGPDEWHEYQLPESALIKPVDDYNKGGAVHMAGGSLVKKAAKAVTSRIDMNYKDVTQRTPELQDAANKLIGGELSASEYDALVNEYKPVTPYATVPTPATREEATGALTADKRERYGLPSQTLEQGHPVGLRLDIPSYSNHGVWVPTVHEQEPGFGAGKSIGHESVASVLNPQFGMSEKAALAIASGKPKGTIATIKGDWNKISEQEAIERAKEYLKSPEWRQVGMDPERHSYFYDRATMQPVTSADEALQIGPLVLVKNPVYGKKEDFKYADGGMVDSVAEEAIKNTVTDPQAARMLDLDLAKYALMSQPQRMAGGGIARMAGGGARKVAKKVVTGAPSHVPDFKIKDLGGLAPVQPVSLETKLGAMLNVNPWDVMHRNQQIMEVSGLKVPDEVISHGGQPYVRDLEHMKQRIGGASNEGIAKRVQNRFDIASREGAARGGTGEVVASPFTMGDTSVNFAMPVTELYRSYFNANATPKDFQDLSDSLRSTTVKGKKPFADAPNFDDPAVDQYIRENPNFRKEFLDKMQTGKRWQELTGINPLDALAAFRDPNLLGVAPYYAGHTLIDVQPGAGLRLSNNRTYSHEWDGLYGGSIPNTPVPILLNEAFTPIAQQMRARSLAPTWKNGPQTNEQIAALANEALGKRNENISELVTDEMIRRVEDYHKGLKTGAFPADDLTSAMEHLKLPKFKDGGKADDDIMSLKPQPKPAIPTVRELVAEIGKNPARYEAPYPPKDATPLSLQAYHLMQAAKKTPDANRYLESLNPYFDSQLRFDIGAGSDAGYVKFKEPNIAVMQKLEDVKNTIPHELTHTLQLGKGANVNLERDRQVMQRAQGLPAATQQSVLPSTNRFENMKEVWANINARAHEVNAAGGDFINTPEGRALFPTPEAQREYYTKSMPGVNSMTPSTGTFVPNRRYGEGGGVFNPQGSDYDYQTARAYGMGQGDNGHWGSVAPTSESERKLHGLPEDSYVMLKGAEHPTWSKAVEAEESRGSKIVKYGDRYYSVPGKAEGGEVSQSELDRMRFEIAQQQNPSSPVMQATPRSAIQDFIGTAGGYMDRAGKFVSEAIAPTAEKHPVKHFLADLILAESLKSAGTALQDYTGTAREADEDNPVRSSVISKNFRNLTNSTEPLLDPRALDVAGFATPIVRGATKLVGAGAKAIAPFATRVDDMVRELSASGAMPQPGLSIKDVTPKVLAPANAQGFYSPTEAAALNLQRQSGSGQALLNDILKGENVRAEEVSGMGLDTFLKDKPNATAAEVQDYIAKNKLQLGDRTYKKENVTWGKNENGEIVTENLPNPYTISSEYGKTYITNSKNNTLGITFKNEAEAKKYIEDLVVDDALLPNDLKWAQWSLPGGENHREVTLNLPSGKREDMVYKEQSLEALKRGALDYAAMGDLSSAKQLSTRAEKLEREIEQLKRQPQNRTPEFPKQAEIDDLDARMAQLKAEGNREEFGKLQSERTELRAERSAYLAREEARLQKEAYANQFRESHWEDPNVLAHLRMSDRVTDGKKTLLVDELQSDWHQKGRERGYRGDEIDTKGWTVESLYVTKPEEVAVYDARGKEIWAGKSKGDEAQTIAKVVEELKKKQVPQAPYKDDYYQLALRRAIKDAIDGGYDRVALPTGSRVAERFGTGSRIDRLDYNKNSDGTYGMSAIKNGREVAAREYLSEDEFFGLIGKDIAKKVVDEEGGVSKEVKGRWGPDDDYFENFKSLTGLDHVIGGKGMKKYYDEIYPGYLKKFGKKYGANVGNTTVDADGVAEPLFYMDITPAMRKEFSTGIHMKRGGKVSFASNVDAMRYELNKRQ